MDAARRIHWLSSIVLMLTAAALVALLGRVLWIERHASASMLEQLARQYTASVSLRANRGGIKTADGTDLALSVRMYNLYADPCFIADPKGYTPRLEKLETKLVQASGSLEQAAIQKEIDALKQEMQKVMLEDGEQIEESRKLLCEALSPIMNKPAEEIRSLIDTNTTYANGTLRRFLWLAREVDEAFYERFQAKKKELREKGHDEQKTASKIKDKAEREQAMAHARLLYHAMDGVGFQKSFKRIYPQGKTGSTLVGFANNDGGVDAMEHQLEFLLRGINGQMLVTKDAARHTLNIQDDNYTPPDDGRTVWLTINSVMQGIVEEELEKAVTEKGAESGTCVVLDPHSGRILAMATYPTFDPAQYSSVAPVLRRNKAVTDPIEPGSIFKPFVMAWAIEKKIIKPTDAWDCHFGVYRDPTGRVVRDVHGYGALSTREVLVKSSNIGMVQIGWKMGIPALHEGVTTFGFGKRTGVEIPGDQRGVVKAVGAWNKGTLTSVPFGYEVSATPLQLVRAFATFANGGYLVTPRIISAYEDSPGNTVAWSSVAGAPLQQQIISKKTADVMRDIMADVLSPTGTAKNARSKVYNMWGKTGTAKIAAHGVGTGYGDRWYDSSFLCGGPVVNPRLVTIVTMHKPDKRIDYYGGTVAAPAATAIMERALLYLQVPPDATAAAPTGATRRH